MTNRAVLLRLGASIVLALACDKAQGAELRAADRLYRAQSARPLIWIRAQPRATERGRSVAVYHDRSPCVDLAGPTNTLREIDNR